MEIGRAYTEQEDVPGGPKLVVLSYGFWRNQFGGEPNVVGKTLELSGEAYTVAGVVGSFPTPWDHKTDSLRCPCGMPLWGTCGIRCSCCWERWAWFY